MKIIYKNNKVGNIDFITTDIKGRDVTTEDGKKKFVGLMAYFTKKFIDELEYENADAIIDYAWEKGIELKNSFVVEHDSKKALVSLSYFSGKIKVRPYLDITSPSFSKGWTFESGHFSDVSIFLSESYVSISTIDTLREHDVFLLWLIEHVQEAFYGEFDESLYSELSDGYYVYGNRQKFYDLASYVEEAISKNKAMRIDTLTYEGKKIYDYIQIRKIYKYYHLDSDIFRLCYEFKKPFAQVEKYVKLHGI